MATTRLLRTPRVTTFASISHNPPSTSFSIRRITFSCGDRKSATVIASVATSENAASHRIGGEVDLATLLEIVKVAGVGSLKVITRKRPWTSIIQMFIEKVILDSRFFAMLAVAGSLIGSILCFLEGWFIIAKSYVHYFHALSVPGSDKGHVIHLLIEAIDMFLLGTAMIIFGMGLHVMFVGARNFNGKVSHLHPSRSNLFGVSYLRKLPSWVSMGSITEAKSRIGHALMMILQVGVLDKFTSVPMTTGLDLACFAASLFISSACIFLLSKLSFATHRSSSNASVETYRG
jgi:uncharacterized membrane protein YqhA